MVLLPDTAESGAVALAESLDAWMRRADAAMYPARARGRNRVERAVRRRPDRADGSPRGAADLARGML